MEPSMMPAILAAIEVVFLCIASLSIKANELMLAFVSIICIVAMVILVVGTI